MQHPTSLALYAYWNDLRGDRIAPRRFDIEPSQLGTLLAETFILECHAGQPALFRLAGTKICESFGTEFRGARFTKLFAPDAQSTIEAHLEDLRSRGAVQVFETAAVFSDARRVDFEIVLLPLVHTGTTISRVVGAIAPINQPHWLGTVQLPPLAMLRHERIWPDGRPHAVAERFRDQRPLVAELADARLVRINRRSFRIVDGGRSI